MSTKTAMGVVAAILLGSLPETAAEEYGVDVFAPVPELVVSAIENSRVQLDRRNSTHFTADEMAAFERARHLD